MRVSPPWMPPATNSTSRPWALAPAMSVATPSPMESTRARVERPAGQLAPPRASAGVVDRRVGLAGHHRLAAQRLVELGQRAAAVDQPVAALHHLVGVGADHRQARAAAPGRAPRGSPPASRLVVDRAGAGDEGGARRAAGEAQAEALVERRVALGADRPGRAGRALGQQGAGDVAGGDDAPTRPRAARRGRRAAAITSGEGRGELEISTTGPIASRHCARAAQGSAKASRAVVDHAPDVAEQHVVAAARSARRRDGACRR